MARSIKDKELKDIKKIGDILKKYHYSERVRMLTYVLEATRYYYHDEKKQEGKP